MLCLDVIFRYMMVLFGFILSSLKINYLSSSVSNSLPIGGGGGYSLLWPIWGGSA